MGEQLSTSRACPGFSSQDLCTVSLDRSLQRHCIPSHSEGTGGEGWSKESLGGPPRCSDPLHQPRGDVHPRNGDLTLPTPHPHRGTSPAVERLSLRGGLLSSFALTMRPQPWSPHESNQNKGSIKMNDVLAACPLSYSILAQYQLLCCYTAGNRKI